MNDLPYAILSLAIIWVAVGLILLCIWVVLAKFAPNSRQHQSFLFIAASGFGCFSLVLLVLGMLFAFWWIKFGISS